MRPEPLSKPKVDIAERVRSLLASKALTLSQISQRSALLYGRSSPYFLPHNFYYDLNLEAFSPSIYQIFALSRISGYRFDDCLRVFEFDPAQIPRLQVLLPLKRTILLDASLDDPDAWLCWVHNRGPGTEQPANAPLAQLLELTPPRRLRSLSHVRNQSFLYARIGREDALAFPDLLPGSIVRADPRRSQIPLPGTPGITPEHVYLLEDGNGFYCSRLRAVGNNQIAPVSAQFPYQPIELELSREVRIHGVVDLEIRPLWSVRQTEPLTISGKPWRPEPLVPQKSLSRLVRGARRRAGLSFREASLLSHRIAELLGDEQYFLSPSSLSDYEARDVAPRHVHKLITLCLLYGVRLSAFLQAAGIALEEAGQEAIPDHLIPRPTPIEIQEPQNATTETEHGGFLGELLGRIGDIPLFLRPSLGNLSGLSKPSLHDFFWLGGEQNPLHPYLVNAILVAVNRRKKKPRCDPSKQLWQQALYVIVERKGGYRCGCCGVENGSLVLYPFPQNAQTAKRFDQARDAEIIGEVTAIIRRLS